MDKPEKAEMTDRSAAHAASEEALHEYLRNGTIVRRVKTWSMAPALQPGDMVRIKPSGSLPRPGEIWAFYSADASSLIVHRILCCRAYGKWILTKGDALLLPDGWISRERFYGKIIQSRVSGGGWKNLSDHSGELNGLVRSAAGSLRRAAKACFRRLLRRGKARNRQNTT